MDKYEDFYKAICERGLNKENPLEVMTVHNVTRTPVYNLCGNYEFQILRELITGFLDLQAENAALRERLKKAVGLPVKIGDTVYCVNDEDCHYVVETTTVTQENFYLLCSRIKGNPSDAFLSREAAEAWLKELQGGEE